MKLNFKFFNKLPTDQKKLTLSTKITILRILLVPIIVIAMIKSYWKTAFWLIVISAVSDAVDGMLARMRNEKTILGAYLDPLADKFFILSCYFALSLGYFPDYKLPFWFTWIVFIKEFFLIIGAILIYRIKGWIEVKPILAGKFAMDVQSLFILWIFINFFFGFHFEYINNFFLFSIIILVLYSFFQYAKLSLKQLNFQSYFLK